MQYLLSASDKLSYEFLISASICTFICVCAFFVLVGLKLGIGFIVAKFIKFDQTTKTSTWHFTRDYSKPSDDPSIQDEIIRS